MPFRGFQPTPEPGGESAGRSSNTRTRGQAEFSPLPDKLAVGVASLLFNPDGTQKPGRSDATLEEAFTTTLTALELISTDISDYDPLPNDDVVRLFSTIANIHRGAAALLAVLSGQLDRRSAPELGAAGLARQQGHRTPIQMAKVVGRLPGVDASKAIRAGRIINETQIVEAPTPDGAPPTNPVTGEVFEPTQPWLAPVGRALTRGLSPAAADAIQRGLGTPTEGVPAAALMAAAERLCVEGEKLDPDLLFERARRARDDLDAAGIGLREEERRQKRSLTLVRRSDGMYHLVWVMDPETGAVVSEVFDRLTSPRRGGPRHGAGTKVQEHADRILGDTRTVEQLASDGFAQLLQNGVATDPSLVLGTGTPAVRVVTTARPLPSGVGFERAGTGEHDASETPRRRAGRDHGAPVAADFGPGWIEGQQDPVSPETVARLICTGTVSEIPIDETGQPLDVGREQRLFNRDQRVAFGVRDGGCRAGDFDGNGTCDRPPSWTEAHHVEQWERDGGRTDIANGILLCKYHHMELHNRGWEIHRRGSTYWLIPPVSVDPSQTPRRMPSRSNAMEQLARLAQAEAEAQAEAGAEAKAEAEAQAEAARVQTAASAQAAAQAEAIAERKGRASETPEGSVVLPAGAFVEPPSDVQAARLAEPGSDVHADVQADLRTARPNDPPPGPPAHDQCG